MNVHSDNGGLSESDQYEPITPVTATERPTSATTSVKKQNNNTWLLCLTAGCVINFVLVFLTISLLAYYLSKYIATQSEVTRISQELQLSQMFSEANGSSFGSPGPVGPPGPSGLPGSAGKTNCVQQQICIY